MSQRNTHHRSCTLCEAMCGLVIGRDGDRVTFIRGDPDDPLSGGHVCPKAVALQDLHTDPDRLRQPMRRVGTRWEPMSWPEAIRFTVSRIQRIQREHGNDAVASYVGNPTVHSLGAMLFISDVLRALRSKNRFSATSVDQLPAHVAAMHLFGHALLIPIPDLDRTEHLLVFGANPVVSNGSLMTAPGAADRLKAIRARGGRLVVIDPRRSETAAIADAHHAIIPGTDALLLLALLHVVFADGLESLAAVAPYLDGIDQLRKVVEAFPPERVAGATGIDATTIRTLAHEFARAPTAAAYGRVGTSMQEFGGLATWLIAALNIVCGRLDTPGGVMFTEPAVDVLRADQRAGRLRFDRWRSRVRGLPEFAGELPVAALAEEIETPGPGQVRALLTHAGNPVLSTPNGTRLDQALASLEFFVAIDSYINETTRHAHLILPPTSPLERDHYDLIFHALAVRNTARFSPALFPRAEGERHDWEILAALTEGLARGARERVTAWAKRRIGPRRIVDWGLRLGPYGSGWNPFGSGLSVRKLLHSVHGIDLGPLRPTLPGRLRTPDRRIDLAPARFVADIPRLEQRLLTSRADAGGTLALIGRRTLRSSNSWMHNSERLVRGAARCTLLMHPNDAAARGLRDGETVRVTARVGAVDALLELDTDLRPGVVSLPHGWGHGREGVRLRVARRVPGVSINDLTDEQRVDLLTGNAAFSGEPVVVTSTGPRRHPVSNNSARTG